MLGVLKKGIEAWRLEIDFFLTSGNCLQSSEFSVTLVYETGSLLGEPVWLMKHFRSEWVKGKGLGKMLSGGLEIRGWRLEIVSSCQSPISNPQSPVLWVAFEAVVVAVGVGEASAGVEGLRRPIGGDDLQVGVGGLVVGGPGGKVVENGRSYPHSPHFRVSQHVKNA